MIISVTGIPGTGNYYQSSEIPPTHVCVSLSPRRLPHSPSLAFSLQQTTVPIVPEVWSEASYGCPDGFDSQARWRGTAETGAHERQRAGIAEAETHGRTVDFRLPHTGESRACHQTQSTGLERGYVSTLIGDKTVKQRSCSSFF